MDDQRFTVISVDGEVADLTDVYTQSLRYDGLSWTESVELARLSFLQGYTIVIWQEDTAEDGGGGACAET